MIMKNPSLITFLRFDSLSSLIIVSFFAFPSMSGEAVSDQQKLLVENIRAKKVFEIHANDLKRTPDLNYSTQEGSPLTIASAYGNRKLVEQLLKANADPNYRDAMGATPLANAVFSGSKALVKLLIKSGADINGHSLEDSTPLMIACGRQNIDMVKLLIKNGADVNLQSTNGVTPIILAATADAEQNDISASTNLIKTLLQKKADINHRDSQGRTALHYAVEGENKDILLFLLNNRADPKLTDNNQQTPLALAQKYGLTEIVQLLSRQELSPSNPAVKGFIPFTRKQIQHNENSP